MSAVSLRIYGLLAVLLVAAGAGAYYHFHRPDTKPEDKKDTKASEKSEKLVSFKSAADAAAHGIVSEPVKLGNWRPRILVDGRVIANPNATLDVQAPFAGTVDVDADAPPFRLGTPVKAGQTLAVLQARFTSFEKLDLRAKLVDAEESWKAAEKKLKTRQTQMDRLDKAPANAFALANLENARIQLVDAQRDFDLAHAQRSLWRQALDAVGTKSITVKVTAPISGAIAEIGAQPGANLEAGKLLIRIVDFRRVLIRLDFPISAEDAGPPPEVEVETPAPGLAAPKRWLAKYRAAAPAIEPGLQKASYLYEIMPPTSPGWRPGLYVTAVVPDPAKASQSVVAVPASAVLMHQGRTLVYIEKLDDDQKPCGKFERREVDVPENGREGDTIYLSNGLHGDELVVTRQAQVLLSEEFRRDEE